MRSPFLSVGILLIPDQLHLTSSMVPQVLLSDADRAVLEDYVGNAAAIRDDAISSRRSAQNEEIGPGVVRSLYLGGLHNKAQMNGSQ